MNEKTSCAVAQELAGPAWEQSATRLILGLMRIWLDVPDSLGDRVAAPGQDLSEAAFHALVIDAYRMGRLTEHELREVLDLPTRDAVDGFLKAHGVPLDYSVEDLAEERALAARLWPNTTSR